MESVRYQGGIRPPDNNYVSTAADQTDEEKMIANAVFVDVNPDMARKLQAAAAAAAAAPHHHATNVAPPSDDALTAAADVVASSSTTTVEQIDDAYFDVNAGILPPNRRAARPESSLTTQERRTLSEMLYETHYKTEVRNGSEGVKAMMYQSALEVKFIEEAIEADILEKGGARDPTVVRQRIKRAVLERCDLHKPLSYIIGYQPFYGCHINCAQPLLCPRPETEMWCHWLVNNFLEDATEPFHVLDMCSGTGCVGVSIAKNAPQAQVVAVDILPEAVKMSNINATRNKIPNERYQCIQSDMFAALEEQAATAAAQQKASPSSSSSGGVSVPYGSVDLIVSNPPYILPNQYEDLPKTITHWESKVALVGDASREDRQYTYFQDLCEKGAKFLKPAGSRQEPLRRAPSMIIEIGIQGEKVASIMEKHPDWIDVELHTDFAGQPRWVSARRR